MAPQLGWAGLECQLAVMGRAIKKNSSTLAEISPGWKQKLIEKLEWSLRMLILENLISQLENRNSWDLVENSSRIGITR